MASLNENVHDIEIESALSDMLASKSEKIFEEMLRDANISGRELDERHMEAKLKREHLRFYGLVGGEFAEILTSMLRERINLRLRGGR